MKTESVRPEGKLYKRRQTKEAKGWDEKRESSSQVGFSHWFMTSERQDREPAGGGIILPLGET